MAIILPFTSGANLCWDDSHHAWVICGDGDTFQKTERGPFNYGPARYHHRWMVMMVTDSPNFDRQVFEAPFLIVVPTNTTSYQQKEFYHRIGLCVTVISPSPSSSLYTSPSPPPPSSFPSATTSYHHHDLSALQVHITQPLSCRENTNCDGQ